MGSSKKQVVGYRYFMDLLMGFGRGRCDAIRRIRIGGRDAWQGNLTSSGVIRINAAELFGGDEGMGGVEGDLHIQMGDPDQVRHPLVVAAFGEFTSALRGVCTGFFTGQIAAMNPNPEEWEVQRTTLLQGWDGPAWYPERASVTPAGLPVPAMNPAHILVKVLTHRDCGRGLPRARLDLASYAAGADRFHAEGLGLCLRWNRQVSVLEFLQQVCDHVGASQYVSRSTGLLTLALARGGYNVDDLPLFTADTGLIEIADDDNPGGWGATNEVIVEWTDPVTNEKRQSRWQNLAAIQAYGRVSETIRYPGLPTPELAARTAQRDGEIRSSAAKRFKVVLDRRGREVQPAGLFRISAPERGIDEIVLRASDVREGPLTDGRIEVMAVQDVFALDQTVYVTEQPGTHVDPDRTPLAATARRPMEASYRDLVSLLGNAEAAALDPMTSALMMAARKPSGMSLGYKLATRTGGSAFAEVAPGDWCPTALLAAPITRTSGTVVITGGSDLHEVEAGEAALIDDEIVRVDAIDLATGAVTVARGCVDTVPAEHAAGARIWFPDSGAVIDPTEYLDGETVQAKVLTRTSTGTLTADLAPTDAIVMDQRQARPYVPGRFRINGQSYPSTAFAALAVAVAGRDRLLQADQLIDADAGPIGPEPGSTWSVRIYRPPSTLLHAATGLTTAEYTWVADADGTVRVEVEAEREGLASWQKHVHTLAVEGGNKVANGTFASDTGWSKGAGWTISSGRATKTAGEAGELTQAVALVAGAHYRVDYTLSNVTAGSLAVQLTGGGAVSGPGRSASGTYTDELVAEAGNDTLAFAADAAFAGRLDDVWVRRIA